MNSALADNSDTFLAHSVAAKMTGYEIRTPQQELMRSCAKTVEGGGILAAEAGTGTGKTFAYLIPIILSGARAIISTKTINLQEQLGSKDLAFLSSLQRFRYAIAKGRGHFICLRRMNAFRPSDQEEAAGLENILEWIESSKTGDIGDYSGQRRPFLWDKVCSDSDACRAKKCKFYKECFYFKARQKWESAQVVVTNHALLTINAMMPEEKRLLPPAEILVIDEGHSLDNIVSEQIGINLSSRGMEFLLNTLLKADQRGTYRGLLAKSPALFSDVEYLRVETGLFWSKVRSGLENRKTITGLFCLSGALSGLSEAVKDVIEKIKKNAAGLFEEDEELELKAQVSKLRSICAEMDMFSEEREGFVRWAELEEKGTALRMTPVYPSDFVGGTLFPDFNAVIITSATLSVSGDFGLIEKVLGLKNPETLAVPSPFDLRKQVKIEIRRGIDLQLENGIRKLAEAIVHESAREQGGSLVLFTSREAMKRTWQIASPELSAVGLNPMVQGELPNRRMLEVMRESTNAVIFGVDSFWEGVDVKGDSLRCLIITKLPFEVPSEPIVAARMEEIKKRGGNAFFEYSLPRAILKFRQGFGRLIRSRDDRGRVVICDGRIETKDYGRKFLQSIV